MELGVPEAVADEEEEADDCEVDVAVRDAAGEPVTAPAADCRSCQIICAVKEDMAALTPAVLLGLESLMHDEDPCITL